MEKGNLKKKIASLFSLAILNKNPVTLAVLCRVLVSLGVLFTTLDLENSGTLVCWSV